MARKLVTQELVNEAVEGLISEGKDPTLVDIQARIGGSFTSIKKCLDHWKEQQVSSSDAVASMPPDVVAKGQELIRAVWISASKNAQRDASVIADKANMEATGMRSELSQAMNEIARLERIESRLNGVVEQQQYRLREVELALAESHVQANRTADLELALAQLRGKYDELQQEATSKVAELGRQSGEAEALRSQLRELMRTLKARKA